MYKKLFLLILVLIILTPSASAAWWNSSWKYSVNNAISDGARPYQISLNISNATGTNNATQVFCNGHCNINFTDIRFTLDNTTVLPYWIEDNVTGKVWVNVTANGTVNMYYGNPSATSSLSNGNNTFIQFQDYTTSDIMFPFVVSYNHVFHYKYKAGTSETYLGATAQSPGIGGDDFYVAVTAGSTTIKPTTYNNNVYTQNSVVGASATTNIYDFIYTSGSVKYYQDAVLVDTITTNVPDANLGMWLQGDTSDELYYGFIREYTSPELTFATWGTEKSITWSNNITNDNSLIFQTLTTKTVGFNFTVGGESTYKWWVNGVVQASTSNLLNYTFATAGIYYVNTSAITQSVSNNWTVSVFAYNIEALTPLNGSTSVTSLVTFTWREWVTDLPHTIYVYSDTQYINLVSSSMISSGTNENFTTTISLADNQQYWWRVKNNSGYYTNTMNFSVSTAAIVPGELNITVFDETNLSKRILNFTIDLYNATSHLTNSTTNGWVNFSGAQVITGEYLIIVTPKEGSNNYYSRMVLADSPYNVTMYVPNSTSPNTINLISFSLLDTTGLFPFQTSTITVSKGGLVQDKSYFSADGTHPVYMLQGTNYQISITHGDNIQNFANFVPLATGTLSITINDFTIEEYTVNPFVYNITYTPSIITLKWNDFNNVMSTLNYTIRKGIAQTLECSLVTGVNSGQSECGIDKTTIYFVIFSATMGDGTFRNTSFVVDYSIVDGARTSSTGTSTIDSSSIGTGFLWNYETFVMPSWVYNWASLILIILLAGSFGGYHSGFGAIVTLIVALFLETLKFFRPLGEDNTVVMGITGALLVIAIFYYMQHKDRGG